MSDESDYVSQPSFTSKHHDLISKSGHVSSFIAPEEMSRPTSPIASHVVSPAPAVPSEDVILNGIRMPPEIIQNIISRMQRPTKMSCRSTCSAFERAIGDQFLPPILNPWSVESYLRCKSRYCKYVKDIIVPLDPNWSEIFSMFVRVEKLRFSTSNHKFFAQLNSEMVPFLRKVTFQGTNQLTISPHIPKTITDVVIWGDRADNAHPSSVLSDADILQSSDANFSLDTPASTLDRKVMEDLIKSLPNLNLLEVWSARHHPEVIAMAEFQTGASLRTIRLMGGIMTSTIPYALTSLMSKCVQLEELVITCVPMTTQVRNEAFDSSILVLSHPILTRLRIRHPFATSVKFSLPNLLCLQLESPQQNQLNLRECSKLNKLQLEAAPRVLAHIFVKAPPALQSARITIVTGDPPHPTDRISSSQSRSGSASWVTRSPNPVGIQGSASMSTVLNTSMNAQWDNSPTDSSHIASIPINIISSSPNEAKDDRDVNYRSPGSSAATTVDDLGEVDSLRISGDLATRRNTLIAPAATYHNIGSNSSSGNASKWGHRGSSRPNTITIKIDSKTLRKLDLRVNTAINSFPRIRELCVEAPQLVRLKLQIHPLAVAPTDVWIDSPNLDTLSACLHSNLIPTFFPNFEYFPHLKHLFVTLQDEDVKEVAELMKPYMVWKLPNIQGIGLSNFSILNSLTIFAPNVVGLILENMHCVPGHIFADMDTYLPNINHLELKSPDGHGHDGWFDPHPFIGQEEYSKLIPRDKPLLIKSSSLQSLNYALEYPLHPKIVCPKMDHLFYVQMDNEVPLHLESFLSDIQFATKIYLGVARIAPEANISSPNLKRLAISFGYGPRVWHINAPHLYKLKLLRVLSNAGLMELDLRTSNTKAWSKLVLAGKLELYPPCIPSLPQDLILKVFDSIEDQYSDDEEEDRPIERTI